MNDQRPALEFWFDFASNYSYLSVMRIEAEAQKRNLRIVWKPFLLGPIFRALAMENSPFVLQKEKGAYMWQDMVRQCRKYGVPWTKPTLFPRLGPLPLRIAVVGAAEPWIGTFCRTVMQLNFARDQDINTPEQMRPILAALDLPATELLPEAQSEPVKQKLRAQTEEAQARGIFGAPMFFVGNEMFWGNDRLDDALDFAAARDG